jgi:hypothetical protein
MEFLNLDKTLGSASYSLENLEFFSFRGSDWGLKDLTAKGLADFRDVLEADEISTLNYLVAKVGFDPSDEA